MTRNARIAVLGATGFIGRSLLLALAARGDTVIALARDPERAAGGLPAGVEVFAFGDDEALARAIDRADAVINLAGESISDGRWTANRKRVLIDSRIATTERLVSAIGRRSTPLPTFISASATGWYGDRGDEELDERSRPGRGFAAELCQAWEAAARPARAGRVLALRFGVVLGREGGALGALRRIYQLGFGGPIGGGRAWFPWVHIDDAIGAITHALDDGRLAGPVNVVAPGELRQREFAAALGRALRRPARVPTPNLAVRFVLGEAASIVTASQRVAPRALRANGFEFTYPAIDWALADLVDDGVTIARADELPEGTEYLRERGARYVLRATTELDAPRSEVFSFFCAPENLAAMTPPRLGFDITSEKPIAMGQNALIDYKIRVGIPMRWRTHIDVWEPGERFVDSQLRGPYRSWWHEHRFVARGQRTVMEDTVYFSPPFGPIGGAVVASMLRRIFGYRRGAIRLRFGRARSAVQS